MRAAGVVLQMDRVGRLVIPIQIRRRLGWAQKTRLEIFVDEEARAVTLRAYARGCRICGEMEGLVTVEGLSLCPQCIAKFQQGVQQGA